MNVAQSICSPLPTENVGPANRTLSLFLVSVLGLFIELMLIRWIGTEIRIFAYLQNTVLVVCFLGLGMGCLTCRQPFVLRQMLIPLFILVLVLAIPLTRVALGDVSQLLSVFGDLVIWAQIGEVEKWKAVFYAGCGLALTLILMVLIWDIFVPLGRLLGRLLDDSPQTIWAYSVNIGGSLVGIWLFVLLSVFYQPPITWLAVTALLMLFFMNAGTRTRWIDGLLLLAIVALGWPAGYEIGAQEVVWSPYQKLTLQKAGETDASKAEASTIPGFKPRHAPLWIYGESDYLVTVNNTGYQAMLDLKPETIKAAPHRFPPDSPGAQSVSQYDIPLRLHPKPKKFLIVGAGSGNDAAGGLRHGVEEVTAVEIDPAIIALGRKHHPEQPYSNPRVRVVNDDARSFFATCTDRFDVIAFGLLDSHTTTAMTNARLDHYVYTRESIARAKSLLADGGIIVLAFEATKSFIADRMALALREVFEVEPMTFRVPFSSSGWGGVMFVTGDLTSARKQIEAQPALAAMIAKWQKDQPIALKGTTKMATDDWPYIYLEKSRIPILYYLLAAMLLVLYVRGARRLHTPGLWKDWSREHWHFFFMGAAFLLLEVQNISKASVVLGNTWLVNAIIISGILAMVLLANALVSKFPRLPMGPVYLLLCGSCIGLYFLDLSRFGFLPYATKAALVGGLTSLPMLFSGIVFIKSFALTSRKDLALGANLFGALIGGLLQSITFVIGIKALLLIVAALYVAALLFRPRANGVTASAVVS